MSPTDTPSDAVLIDRVRAGDDAAFRLFVERHQARVMATITGMLGPDAQVDDIAQESFIRFYQSLNRFRGEAGPATYLIRIAINLSLNQLKKRRRFRLRIVEGDDDTTLDLAADTRDLVDANERAMLVRKAVANLDAPQRAVVVLRLLEGYSTKETANLLGIPIGTVLSRLSRAETRLKRMLGPLLDS